MRFAKGRRLRLAAVLLLSAAVTSYSATEERPVDWIRNHAIPLQTVEAGHGFDDMQPLAKVVGNARIVALGEATHGTHEFFQLKLRILEFLASQRGFTVFAMEASMPDSYRLNDFVLNGTGDPRQLLKRLIYPIWNTEEVLDMILWMREFNRSGKGPIKFTGFDMQTPRAAIETVQSFVAAHDKSYAARLDPIYAEVTRRTKSGLSAAGSPSQKSEDHLLALQCRGVVEHLIQSRSRFLHLGVAADDVDWIIQDARVVLQYLQLASGERSRDRCMAQNVKWIADHNPGAKIVLWAHNGHVKYTNPPGFDPMGGYLHGIFGRDLVNFGFSFNQGSFRAMEDGKTFREFTVEPLAENSLDRTLASTGIPLFALDLRQVPKDGPVARWFRQDRDTRSIGAVYSEKDAESPMAISSQRWPRAFDVVLFVEKTTAARANP